MTDSTWAIQISPKLPDGTLINVRADTPEQLDQLLEYVSGKGAEIASAIQTLQATGNVGQSFAGPGTQQVPQQGQQWSQQGGQQSAPQQYQPQQPAAPQGGGGPPKMCAHGAMTYREGNGQRGPWKGWFCPTPKNTPGQCKPEFVRD